MSMKNSNLWRQSSFSTLKTKSFFPSADEDWFSGRGPVKPIHFYHQKILSGLKAVQKS